MKVVTTGTRIHVLQKDEFNCLKYDPVRKRLSTRILSAIILVTVLWRAQLLEGVVR